MLVIGLMSGTSVDGIDAALVEIQGSTTDLQVRLLAGDTYAYPPELRQKILDVCAGAALTMAELADLDESIAECFADAALRVQSGPDRAELIGSHGQTVFHRPPPAVGQSVGENSYVKPLGYSQQIGRGAVIAHRTGINTIDNFRSADIAAGGQGAPLVPKTDAYLLGDDKAHLCVQNIGGIGNCTYLPPLAAGDWEEKVLGWDTGPGNSLIDLAVTELSGGRHTYDANGAWAASGQVDRALVDRWLQQDYFRTPPPKSTGRELFGRAYLQDCRRDGAHLSDADFMATITDLTAASIADSYQRFLPQLPDRVLLCGGGARNGFLRQCLQEHLPKAAILTTDEVGLNGDFKEAIAFAILAYWRWQSIPGNLPAVTGACAKMLLGDLHLAFV
jgi:anhydro-N-acetylmuramic acid kinase